MPIYKESTLLADIVFQHPSVITVLNRFGINLGLGNKTVEDTCNSMGIDTHLFITILNTYVNEEYVYQDNHESLNLIGVIDYLRKTDNWYENIQLPNIERHFKSLLSRSIGETGNLNLLLKFFEEVRDEMLSRINFDRTIGYNAIITNTSIEEISEDLTRVGVEEKLADLCSFFIVHINGSFDQNLCMAVISTLFALVKDVKQNNRIRTRILLPILSGKNNIRPICK